VERYQCPGMASRPLLYKEYLKNKTFDVVDEMYLVFSIGCSAYQKKSREVQGFFF
jgi:hypothetical protein